MTRCVHCGYRGRPAWRPAWIAVLAVLVWLLPLLSRQIGQFLQDMPSMIAR